MLPSNGPMRISLVSPGFPPQLGGVEVVVGHLADELRGHGHQVTVYAQRPRGSSFSVWHDHPVRRFADWSGSRQFPVAPGLVRALWRDRGRFDLIHAHSFHTVPAMTAATVPKVPLVFTPHFHAVGHTRVASTFHAVYDPLATFLFRRACRVTCVSVAESELLLRRYPFVEPRLSVIPLGVDTQALLGAEPFETGRPGRRAAGSLQARRHGHAGLRGHAEGRTAGRLRNRFSPAGARAPCPGAGDREQGLLPGRGQRSRAAPVAAHGHLNREPVGQGGFRAGAPGGGRGGQPGGGFRHSCPCRTGAAVGDADERMACWRCGRTGRPWPRSAATAGHSPSACPWCRSNSVSSFSSPATG
jgi:Glycosyltransferase Family 4